MNNTFFWIGINMVLAGIKIIVSNDTTENKLQALDNLEKFFDNEYNKIK